MAKAATSTGGGKGSQADVLTVTWAELEQLGAESRTPVDPDGSFTASEYAAHSGLGYSTAARRLRELVIAGRLQTVKAPKANLWGDYVMRPAYRIAKGK